MTILGVAIIKADDFIPDHRQAQWAAFFDCLVGHGVPASIGLIGGLADNGETEVPRYADQVAAIRERTGSEFFDHGFWHRRDEFRGAAPAAQRDSLERSQAFGRALGLELRVFGAPYNRYDEATLAVIDDMPGIEIVYHAEGARSWFSISRRLFVSTENREKSHNPDAARFRRRIEHALEQGQTEFVLQVHPWRWSSRGVKSFDRMLAMLDELGVRVVTAAGYRGLRTERPLPQVELEQWRDRIRAAVDRRVEHVMCRGREAPRPLDHPFFRSRYGRGGGEWSDKVNALDLGVDNAGAGTRMLDVGAGIGQWSVGFALRYPQAMMTAVEPNPELVDLFERTVAGTALEQRVEVRSEPAEEMQVAPGAYDVILLPGVLMYTDHERALERIATAARPGARMYVMYHQDGHHFMRTLETLDADPDLTAIRTWSRTHVAIHQHRLGLFSTYNDRQRCLPRAELEQLLASFGFRVVERPAIWDVEPRDYRGVESFTEHIFEFVPEAAVDLGEGAGTHEPATLSALVAVGRCRAVWKYLLQRRLADDPAHVDCYVRACIGAGEAISALPRHLASEHVSDRTRLLHALETGDLEAGAKALDRAEMNEAERVFLGCCLRRGRGRPADVYPLARSAIDEIDPRSHYLWSMLFYLGARLESLEHIERDRRDWPFSH